MSDTQPVDLAGLRARAEAATPGPWVAEEEAVEHMAGHGDWCYLYDVDTTKADARYIAAANPSTVLALIADLDAARAEVTRLRGAVAKKQTETDQWMEMAHQREAEIERLTKEGLFWYAQHERRRLERDTERARADTAIVGEQLQRARDSLMYHTTTHNCFTDVQLTAYRVRQRGHGARELAQRVDKLLKTWDTIEDMKPLVASVRKVLSE